MIPSGPLSLRRCLSRSLSACLASFSVWRVLALWAASSPAAPFLCWALPSAFFSSSPVKAPAASFILPLALSSTPAPFARTCDQLIVPCFSISLEKCSSGTVVNLPFAALSLVVDLDLLAPHILLDFLDFLHNLLSNADLFFNHRSLLDHHLFLHDGHHYLVFLD